MPRRRATQYNVLQPPEIELPTRQLIRHQRNLQLSLVTRHLVTPLPKFNQRCNFHAPSTMNLDNISVCYLLAAHSITGVDEHLSLFRRHFLIN